MKKQLLLVLVALLALGTPSAKAQLDFGVVTGMNLNKANFKGSYHENFDSSNRAGWFVGPKLEATLPLVGIGVDVAALYSQRYLSCDIDQGPMEPAIEKTTTLKTIAVPINLRYQVGFKSILAAYVATGPQFDFNVGSSRVNDINVWSKEYYKVKNSTLSWNIGVGVKALKHLEVGVGYNIALSKFAKWTGTQESSVKTNTFQAHVGYFF